MSRLPLKYDPRFNREEAPLSYHIALTGLVLLFLGAILYVWG